MGHPKTEVVGRVQALCTDCGVARYLQKWNACGWKPKDPWLGRPRQVPCLKACEVIHSARRCCWRQGRSWTSQSSRHQVWCIPASQCAQGSLVDPCWNRLRTSRSLPIKQNLFFWTQPALLWNLSTCVQPTVEVGACSQCGSSHQVLDHVSNTTHHASSWGPLPQKPAVTVSDALS